MQQGIASSSNKWKDKDKFLNALFISALLLLSVSHLFYFIFLRYSCVQSEESEDHTAVWVSDSGTICLYK